MLCACLKELKRFDVLEMIRDSDEEQGVPAPAQVFVSYQWDNQAEVLLIRSQVREYIINDVTKDRERDYNVKLPYCCIFISLVKIHKATFKL